MADFKSDDARKQFIDHLNYLFTLSYNHRVLRDDYQQMKQLLTFEGYWKNKARGEHATIPSRFGRS